MFNGAYVIVIITLRTWSSLNELVNIHSLFSAICSQTSRNELCELQYEYDNIMEKK